MSKHRLHRFKRQITRIILFFVLCSLFFVSIGCEAFVRKFTRKPKKENLPKEEMILAPEEYKGPQMNREELYRQYFLFWKSWQDELLASLSGQETNHKKQVDCASETIKNLMNLRPLLNEDKQKQLDIYLSQLNGLKDLIAKDTYGNSVSGNRRDAERLKRNILRDFSYREAKDHLL